MGFESTGTGGQALRAGRVFAALNALLFVVLAALVGWNASARRPGPPRPNTRPPVAASELTYRVERSVERGESVAFVVFSSAIVDENAIGSPPPRGLVRLDPDRSYEGTWMTPYRLHLRPTPALGRGRRVQVHVDEERLPGWDGTRELRHPERRWIDTESVHVRSAVAAEHDASGAARAVVLTFDADVAAEVVEKAVSVHRIDDDGVTGNALPIVVSALDAPGEHAWKLALPMGELPGSVVVRVSRAIVPRGGEISPESSWERALILRPELFITSVRSNKDGIRIEVNHEVPLPRSSTFTIDPPVDVQVHRRWDELRLYGDFAPGAEYVVTFHEGFPGSGPARLLKAVERSVRIPDLRPKVAFPDRGSVLSSRARHEIAVACVNVRRIEVAARTVYANNVVRLTQSSHLPDTVFGPWARTEIAVFAELNERATERVSLDTLLAKLEGGTARGLHQIRVRDVDGDARSIDRLVQITDLGVTVRSTRDALALRVTSIATALPVAGAEVVVRTPTNQILCTGVSRDDGTALLRFGVRGDDRVPYLVEVTSGDDQTFVDLDGFEVTLAEEAQSGRPFVVGGFECHVHPDRGAVRPGETARVTITGRSARGVSPVGAEVVVRWIGPDGATRRSERMTFDDSGLLAAVHATSTADPTGIWHVQVRDAKTSSVLGNARFLVEAFVPDRLEASVEVLGTPTLGDQARLRVRSAWLEGSPAAGRLFRATVRLDHTSWQPEGFEGYSFGPLFEGAPTAPPGTLPSVKGVLDEDGEVDVAIALPDGTAGVQAYLATMSVEVSDPSGRPVRAGLRAEVTRGAGLLGARVTDEGLELVVTDRGGQHMAVDTKATVTLERRRWSWRSRTRRTRDGRRRTTWQPFVEATPEGRLSARIVDGRAVVELKRNEDRGGWLVAVVRAEIDGHDLRTDAPVGGVASRPDRLRVDGPPDAVQPGAEIDLTIASPTTGTAFVTFETTTVHAVATAVVERGRDTIRVVVPEDIDGPNVHAVVTIVAPQARADATPPYWIVGSTSLDVQLPERESIVSLTTPEIVLPGSDVEILVEAPGATRATVALVDEGVLRVTGHQDPDPLAFFRARRRLASLGADTGARLMERPGYDPDMLDGGDEDARGSMAERLEASTTAEIETVALFTGPVDLDPEGRARVTFSLPEYEGRLRALVIAAGPTRVGAGAADVIVRAPLGLRIAAPRRLSPGDVSTATVTLRNGTGVDADIDVTLFATEGLELRGNAERTVSLADGTSMSFDLEIVGSAPADAAALEIVATCGDERRVVHAAVPVRPAGLYETLRVGLRLTADAEVAIPGTWVAGTRHARLIVAPGVGADLLPSLEALLGYPHGCVEQTSSKMHAVLASRPLLKELSPGAAARSDEMIVQGIARLRSMQTPRGGMSFWPGDRNEVDLGSLVALDVLIEARDQGFDVDERALGRLLRRVEHRVARVSSTSHRAMAVEILSRGGIAVGPWLADLATSVERREDRARVALAFARLGDEKAARELLHFAGRSGDTTVEAGGLLFSPTRERAFVLRALLEAAPDDERIDVLAGALRNDAIHPAGLTTQSQSHAVRALAALHLRDLHAAEPVDGHVRVGNVAHSVSGRTEIQLPANGDGVARCALSGPTAALLEVRGIRTDVGRADDEGVFRVTRRIVDAETGEPATALRRGHPYDVILEVQLARRTSNVLLTDVLPAGLEAESPRLGAARKRASGELVPDQVDVRDDRVLLHIDDAKEGAFHVRYRAHAVFPGRYAAPPPLIEALYAPGSLVRGRGGDGLEITK